MDSRIVAKEIKNRIWPLLRKGGFAEFTVKTAWRRLPEQIHVVNFQSFNSYLADGLGCTTFSFAINLGIYFCTIPSKYLVHSDPSKPKEYDCHFRRHLKKGIEQPFFPRRDIWYIERDGGNVLETLADAQKTIERDGLPWFDRFASLDDVLSVLMEENPPEVPGARQSPARKYMIGYIARRLGRSELAEPMIAESERELEAIRVRLASTGRRKKPKAS